MTALVLAQIPDPHVPAAITADQLALIRMNHNIIHRHPVCIVALHVPAARVPDLDGAVLARRHQPLALAVERHARDVAGVAVKRQDRVGVGRLDVVELDRVVACGREVALVGRDAQAVDLRVWVRDGARADAGQGFPEAVDGGQWGTGQGGGEGGEEERQYRIVWS